eukprot:CAMPEP_0170652068 /NCGR_PEP_ID=MMETSP0224-20130122/46709_1 /TAXON_ID=285029 /ORGANISM="Togula jolla, Strain CCCM 725" /LENGTH=209 /DNA_ID=CAMNT_0010983913 /DNA_START=9 /DNA_END=636 /DNA_ORIENTATION=+
MANPQCRGPPNPNEAPIADRGPVPPTPEAFVQLHNGVAMPLMQRVDDLGKAFWAFTQANDLHGRLVGRPSAEALYNAACCLSRAVEEQVKRCRGSADGKIPGDLPLAPGSIVAPEAPPAVGAFTSARAFLDARADLAGDLLLRAIHCGGPTCPSAAHMQADADLYMLRKLRPSLFQSALQQVAHAIRKCALLSQSRAMGHGWAMPWRRD